MSAVHNSRYRYLIKRLRLARQMAELTQVEAAKRLGKTQNFVSKCESGERRLDAIELLDFATVYDKPLTFFLPRAPRGAKPPTSFPTS